MRLTPLQKSYLKHFLKIEFVTKLSSGVLTSVEVSELLYCDVLQNFFLNATAPPSACHAVWD